MRALKASMFIGVSAFFRVLFAQRIFDTIDLKACIAFSLTALAVYILDRSFDFSSNKEIFLAIAFALAASLIYPNNPYIPFLALFVGFMYSNGIKGFRLKKGYGIKNIVTAVTWGTIIAFFSKIDVLIIAFFTLKSFIITVLSDIKDLKEDLEDGIKTIPAILGDKTLHFLMFVNILLHAIVFTLMPLPCYLLSLLISFYAIINVKPKVAQAEFILQSILISSTSFD